jgi:hypothetical protein
MFEELRAGSPRAEVYWAQQLAFGPVFFYAVLLAVREDILSSEDKDHLRRIVPMALSLLGALPAGNGDPASLLLLARRQASALAVGAANSSSGSPHDSDWRSRTRPTNPCQHGCNGLMS